MHAYSKLIYSCRGQLSRFGPRRLLSYTRVNRNSQYEYSFCDKRRVRLKAGNGGQGCASFHREKYVPYGPPDGGNGGDGGDIYVVASFQHDSLSSINSAYQAKNGQNGKGDNRHGKAGKSVLLRVPVGTVMREIQFSQKESEPESLQWVLYPTLQAEDVEHSSFFQKAKARAKGLVPLRKTKTTDTPLCIDFDKESTKPQLVCKGGKGGLGNIYFLSEENWSPKFATKGLRGEEKVFELELKTICDIGLVGMPNAGKSTLLNTLTEAKSPIGNWEFTTLKPHLGTLRYFDHDLNTSQKLQIADLPGLIEGASKGKGLGLNFLRHVERSRALCMLIDISPMARVTGETAFELLWKELCTYNAQLVHRPVLVLANKADIAEEDAFYRLLHMVQKHRPDAQTIPISALQRHNTEQVIRGMVRLMALSKKK
ncbi:GTPase Mtg2 [Schizosaccharomyces japonicus yFS275]|uniref:GTPase Mtg2 n=1 Tax=Schizosaccharomyces japonicus (strain yFS275 / FY16936) TaxID=402676 RepID=B6JV30_SCHJY|nr:GTPase Mtg2 [Schizosaccharomyces japonicus yFS275]EEB05231.2 GTPase Mtg2 [Schizosaccharomyces japonicus yFS275]